MPHGKFKGELLGSVPLGYLRWMLGESAGDAWLLHAVRAEMERRGEKYIPALEVLRDIEEALNAANAIGDDRLQKRSQGYVVPDAFTHGTSAQRMYWFKKGYETGDLSQGDTFKAADL